MTDESPTPSDSPALLTPKQLATALGTTVSTILQWYHAGKVPAEIAEGACYRFDLHAVNDALETRMQMLKKFYQDRDQLIADGAKIWKIQGPTNFREKMDLASAVKRSRDTKESLLACDYSVPTVPIKSNWEPFRRGYKRWVPGI
ncbi:MAG: helix-turn-helix domain-containing protein [Verrucomicrobiota bacterium]